MNKGTREGTQEEINLVCRINKGIYNDFLKKSLNSEEEYIFVFNELEYEKGSLFHSKDFSNWNGRDHLGKIVAPGTYLIHIEASNFLTADVSEDVAPIVVGVPKQ